MPGGGGGSSGSTCSTRKLASTNAGPANARMQRSAYLVILESDGALDLSEALAVLDATDSALLELHNVLRESARLVAKYVLHLTKLFGKIRGSALCGRVGDGKIN